MRESVDEAGRLRAVVTTLAERVDHQGLRQSTVALVAADGEPGDVRLRRPTVLGGRERHVRDPDDVAGAVGHDPDLPRLEAGPAGGLGEEVVVGLALPDRPLQERVLEDGVHGRVLTGLGGTDGVALGQRALHDRGAGRQLQHPAGPPHPVAEVRQQEVSRGALRDRHADHRAAAGPGGILHPAGQCRADAPAAVARVDGGVAPVGRRDLGVRDQPVTLEHADRRRGDVEARPRPVGDDVGLLDLDHADVGLLLGGHHLEDGARVGGRERARRQPLGEIHALMVAGQTTRGHRVSPVAPRRWCVVVRVRRS